MDHSNDKDDPAPAVEAVEAIKAGLEIHPYTRGATGTAVASFLAGKAPLGAPAARPETTFVDAAHAAFKHDPAERLLLLADDRRARPAGAGRRRRSNGRGQIGR